MPMNMIFQLIHQNIDWYQYLINALLTVFGRSLDILSTRYVTKELKLETNRLAKRIGWKGMILMQIPLVILGSLDIYFSFFIFWWSLLLFANNIEGSWYIREAGEDTYHKELESRLKQSRKWNIILSEFSSFIKFTFAGIFIILFLFIIKDLIAVFFIALALIIQGILGTISSISYLLNLKKQQPKDKENNLG